ncbi:hypothetical protein [Anaeroselena agilis]|uniref:Uncharacterized protein n=1 Tax=Anaeroselena agilis TaxID=3063788 RepID=A0ABU3NWL4_9FIRM|nr:hypothetical protein [Selenomonadales bacterium 4137-cl]
MDKSGAKRLADLHQLWQEVGFEPWTWNGLEGMKRRVTFRKGSLLGEVARYYADDHIVWPAPVPGAEKMILEKWRPADEVMSHRFLLLDDQASGKPQKKYFFLGFRGWLEVLVHRPGDPEVENFRDLVFLVNKAWQYAERQKGGEAGGIT